MKTVNYKVLRKALRELENEFESRYPEIDRTIQFYEMFDCLSDRFVQIGVNWSAIGTQKAEDAVKFAEALTFAAQLASNFKYNGYEKTYED